MVSGDLNEFESYTQILHVLFIFSLLPYASAYYREKYYVYNGGEQMMNIKISQETCEMFTKVLTYINNLEHEYHRLNNMNDGKDYRQDLEWLEAKVCAVRDMFSIVVGNSECVLEYDDLYERWTIRLDLGNKLLANKEDS